MELIIPILASVGAIVLLLIGLVFKFMYEQDELFYVTMILSTIFFFVGGGCFLGVTHINPATGVVVAETGYKFLVYLFIVFGFIPILLLYEGAFGNLSGEEG